MVICLGLQTSARDSDLGHSHEFLSPKAQHQDMAATEYPSLSVRSNEPAPKTLIKKNRSLN